VVGRREEGGALSRLVLHQRTRVVLVGIERESLDPPPPCGNSRFFFAGSLHHYRQGRPAFITSEYETNLPYLELSTVSPELPALPFIFCHLQTREARTATNYSRRSQSGSQ